MKAMLATTASPTLSLLRNEKWGVEPKYDGIRTLVHIHRGVQWRNRNDEELTKPTPAAVTDALNLPGAFILDGELVGDVYYVFDLPHFKHDVTHAPFAQRRELLREVIELIDHNDIRLTPHATSTMDKVNMDARARADRWEGLIFRQRDAPYQPGRRSVYLRKHKFIHTADVIVSALGKERESATLVLIDGAGSDVEVGRASIMGKDRIQVGDVVEVAFLHANSGRLTQPRIMQVRTDKEPRECSLTQLDDAVMRNPE